MAGFLPLANVLGRLMALFSLAPELNGYNTERTRQLFERIEDEFAAVPGVTSVVGVLWDVTARQVAQRRLDAIELELGLLWVTKSSAR